MKQRFEWDPNKIDWILKERKLRIDQAIQAFYDPKRVILPDDYPFEERWQLLGMVEQHLMLLVIHTAKQSQTEEVIRIITFRKATRHERRDYIERNS